MNPCKELRSKHVCVIGAGPSGLISARELRREGHSVLILEQKHDVGGQWLYDPSVQDHTPHSSIYAAMRSNTPREIMGFTGFPFLTKQGRDTRRFPGHEEVWLWLKDLSDWYALRQLTRFNSKVEYVAMASSANCTEAGTGAWIVRSKKQGEEAVEEMFDAVVVATGHNSHPRLPSITGMENWRRKQLHSHVYRVPEPFRDEVVVVVGNAISGQDITQELVHVAKQVHLSTKLLLKVSKGVFKLAAKYQNLCLCPQIDLLCEDGRVVFADGSCVVADTIIYCTGYSYSFPFLDTKGMVTIDDNRVGPLYEHTFPPLLSPSLSFVGIPTKVLGFGFYEIQARWIAQLLSGERELPPPDEMLKAVDEFYHSRERQGVPKRKTHEIADFDYCDSYGENCDFPHLEEWRKELWMRKAKRAMSNVETYRDEWEDDEDLLRVAFESPHFTLLDPKSAALWAWRLSTWFILCGIMFPLG